MTSCKVKNLVFNLCNFDHGIVLLVMKLKIDVLAQSLDVFTTDKSCAQI